VHLHEVAQLPVGGLLDRAHLATAGVVDEDVDPAEPQDGVGDGDAGGVGDVQGGRDRAARVGGDQVVEGLRPAGGGDDGVACGQRRLGDRLDKASL
jgi:hypothetical protein